MNNKILKGASILTVVLMISMVFSPIALAAPVQPHNIYGDTGTAGDYILAFIDGKQYGSFLMETGGVFSLDCVGDDTADTTIKTGGVNGDTIQYVRSTSINGLVTATDTFYSNTETYVAGASNNISLSAAASQALLKVSAVATQSAWVAGTDWMRIYNPTGADVPITGWTYDLGAGGIAITDYQGGTVFPAGGEIYVLAPGLGNSDSIQLISPDTFVVDRVEYGTIGVEPEETDMVNAVAPGIGEEIYRIGFADTNDCGADFGVQPETVDMTAPTIVSTTPVDTATNIAVTSGTYVVEFSEPMDTTITAFLTDLPGAVGAWDGTGMWFNITYTALTEQTTYYVDFTGLGHQDLWSNALTGDTYKDFTTGDFTAPFIVSTIPADTATGVAVTAGTYVVEFSEVMDTTITAFLTDLPGAVGAWAGTGMWFNITYTALTDQTTYYVDFTGQGHTDASVNANALTGDTYKDFTTGDFTAPFIVSTTPADTATNVATTAGTYVVEFSEVMDTTITAFLTDLPGAVGAWAGTGMWFNITYTALTDLTTYYVDFTGQGFQDLAGNALGGDVYKDFTTGDYTAPTIVSTVPADGATSVASTAGTYVVEFSEVMDTTITAFLTDLPGAVGAWDGTGMWFNITYTALTDLTTYYVDFTGQGHTDASINANALTGDTYKDFTTGSGASVPSQINDLMAYGHNPTADDIRLTWTEVAGATNYNIYRSLNVDGTGFDFAAAPYAVVADSGTGTGTYDDLLAYADANNYAWVVRAEGTAGENTTDLDNIAFKLVKTFFTGTGGIGPANNFYALPYRFEFTTASTMLSDMRTYGSPTNSVSSVNRWNQDSSLWENKPPFGGTDFAVTPGEGYFAVVTAASVEYKMVGAYDSSVDFNFFTGTGGIGPANNFYALPYHYSFTTASTMLSDMRSSGSPTNSVSSVNRWNQDSSLWENKPPFGGTDFAVTPGEAYFGVVTAASVLYTPVVNTPGL